MKRVRKDVVVLFTGMGNRQYFDAFGRALYDLGIDDVCKVYEDAAGHLGLASPESLFSATNDNEQPSLSRLAFVAHNLALYAYFRRLIQVRAPTLEIAAMTGESLGMAPALVAAGALTYKDYVSFREVVSRYIDFRRLPSDRVSLSVQGKNILGLADDFADRFSTFEVAKYGGPDFLVVYVAQGQRKAFRAHLEERYKDRVRIVNETPAPSPITHSRLQAEQRRLAQEELRCQGFAASAPQLPVISSSGNGLLTSGERLVDELLATFDMPIRTDRLIEEVNRIGPGAVIEIGSGRKAAGFFFDLSGSPVPVLNFTDEESLLGILATLSPAASK